MFKSDGPICRALTERIIDGPHSRRSKDTEVSFRGLFAKTVECGCRYCYLACKAVEEDVQQPTTMDKYIHAILDNWGLHFLTRPMTKEFFVTDPADDPVIPVCKRIPGHTDSEESLQTALNWINECRETHEICCPSEQGHGQPPKLPLRVIDITEDISKGIRLIQTNGERGYYACLSHCWGGEQPLRTTPDTLSSHLKGFPWDDFPRTFQNALSVTRKLELQYIWIDSLCIVQGDKEDWESQSAQMEKIYQNCVVCIAGSASSGPQKGLFCKADQSYVGLRLSSTEDLPCLDKIYSRMPLEHNPYTLPLLKRGWVFQERLLSPRYLHFGSEELIWECMEQRTCECGGIGSAIQSWLEPKKNFHVTSLQRSTQQQVSLTWHGALQDYTALHFSNGRDIFPAISGLARRIEDATGWMYVAGMWKETLITDLAWKVQRPMDSRRCMPWRAPTFLWASTMLAKSDHNETINNPINYFHVVSYDYTSTETDITATVLQVECVPAGADAMGELASCYLVLSGTLIRTTFRCPSEGDQRYSSRARRNVYMSPAGKNVPLTGLVWLDFSSGLDDPATKAGEEVFCLQLHGLIDVLDPISYKSLTYLLLRQISSDPWVAGTEKGAGEFERIGILEDDYYEGGRMLEPESDKVNIMRNVSVKIR